MILMSIIHVALDYPIKNHFHAHFQYACMFTQHCHANHILHSILTTTMAIEFDLVLGPARDTLWYVDTNPRHNDRILSSQPITFDVIQSTMPYCVLFF